MLEFFGVGKRIVLHLARISPLETIDHLVFEVGVVVRRVVVLVAGQHCWASDRSAASHWLRRPCARSFALLAAQSAAAGKTGLPAAVRYAPGAML